ncbi:hypothetical protein Tco_1173505 [Tanacetum coccineum]
MRCDFGCVTHLVTKEVADTAESEVTKDNEVQPLIRRLTSIIIGREIPRDPTKETLDQSKKLKGVASLPAAAQSLLFLKKGSRATREEFIIKQIPKGSIEGFGVIPEVPDEPKDDSDKMEYDKEKVGSEKAESEHAGEEKANEEIADKEIADEEIADEEKANEENLVEEKLRMNKLELTKQMMIKLNMINLILSSAEYDNQFIIDSFDISVASILKEPTELEIQSMVNVPIHQEDPTAKELHSLILLSLFLQRLSELEKKVKVLSKVDHAEAIEESVQANNPINLFQSSSTSTDSFAEYELKSMLFDKMQKSGSFQEHEKHLDLYNALIGSIGLDEAISKGEIDPSKVLKKRHHDDEDKDPSVDSEKEKKKRRRKDSGRSKDKEPTDSSKKGKAPSQPSKTDKPMNAEEVVQEVAMEAKEPVNDDLFNELVNTEKDPLTFDDLMGSTIDFTKFSKNHLKKDKITKADIEGPAFKLLEGTCRNSIEPEYNLEHYYLALSDQLDWANPEGDRCPYDLSKPLLMQGPLGHLTIHVDYFFNNDLEYLKTRNKERKYVVSLTKI